MPRVNAGSHSGKRVRWSLNCRGPVPPGRPCLCPPAPRSPGRSPAPCPALPHSHLNKPLCAAPPPSPRCRAGAVGWRGGAPLVNPRRLTPVHQACRSWGVSPGSAPFRRLGSTQGGVGTADACQPLTKFSDTTARPCLAWLQGQSPGVSRASWVYLPTAHGGRGCFRAWGGAQGLSRVHTHGAPGLPLPSLPSLAVPPAPLLSSLRLSLPGEPGSQDLTHPSWTVFVTSLWALPRSAVDSVSPREQCLVRANTAGCGPWQEEGRASLGCWRVCACGGPPSGQQAPGPRSPGWAERCPGGLGCHSFMRQGTGQFAQPSPSEEWGSHWGWDRPSHTERAVRVSRASSPRPRVSVMDRWTYPSTQGSAEPCWVKLEPSPRPTQSGG